MPSFEDISNGYDAIAEEFCTVRSDVGRILVQDWAASLPKRACVIDIGSGSGEPLTRELLSAGLNVSAIDASRKMVAMFQQYFPHVEIACEPAETSRFFDRTFDAALAIGLIFLLPAHRQAGLIRHISTALKPGGVFLFSAPRQVGTWNDLLSGRPSSSLGAEEYRRILTDSGFHQIKERVDEGKNHHYEAKKKH